MEELQIKVTQNIGSIDVNMAEIEAKLKEKLAEYEGIVITSEDDIAPAKKDVAELKKNITAIEDERKKIKKLWNEPYTKFESDCKKLVARINETIEPIQKQIDEYDAKRIEEKKVHLNELYLENVKEYGEYLSFEETLAVKWQNKTYSDKDYLYDLSEKVVRIRSDIDVIKSLSSEIEEELLRAYKDSGNNLSSAIKRNQQYLADKARVEEKAKEQAKAEVKQDDMSVSDIRRADEEYKMFATDGQKYFDIRLYSEDDLQSVKAFLNFSEIRYDEV